MYLIATRDIYPKEENFVAYGAAYWAIQQGLSMEKAIQAQRNYNLTKLPPYVPDSSSTAKWTPQADPQVQEETTLQRVVADSIKSAGIVTPPPDYFLRDRGGEATRRLWSRCCHRYDMVHSTTVPKSFSDGTASNNNNNNRISGAND